MLKEKKLNTWRLDTSPNLIYGFVTCKPDSVVLNVRDESFLDCSNAHENKVSGQLIVYNSLSEYNSAVIAESNVDFQMRVFADLKSHVFHYTIGFPIPPPLQILNFKHSDSVASVPFPIWKHGAGYQLPALCCRRLVGNRTVFSNHYEATIERCLPFGETGIDWLPSRSVELADAFRDDGSAAAEDAARLNLQLMRWRMVPELNIDRISGLKCLLIGAGTLGTHLARNLLAWGVRHITFVDNGRVAYSNPVRQPLFEYGDAVRGSWKAVAAAEALRRIHPSVLSEGHVLDIPMPGHSLRDDLCDAAVAKLRDLIASHDIIFMLTDNRESRWLPTLLTRCLGKIGITIALGFDSWLIVRHGPPHGCYFCIDCIAPKNTTMNRTMDQQCTVSRPGIAPIAASIAGEFVMALLHHPDGFSAAHEYAADISAATRSPLGVVPHILRGFVSHLQTLVSYESASNYCSACSSAVCDAYLRDGSAFIRRVCNDDTVLPKLTCVNEMIDDLDADD